MEKKKPQIVCVPNGPLYLISDPTPREVPYLEKGDGEPISSPGGVALCRCGKSDKKPFCDGAHLSEGFSGKKEISAGDVKKRRNYVGREITVHDKRNVCTHSGKCVLLLDSVFNVDKKPWVAPDAASVEKIIETVKKCPSGALSYTVKDSEEVKNYYTEPKVTVTQDGPYDVQGNIDLFGANFDEEVSREHYSLGAVRPRINRFAMAPTAKKSLKDDFLHPLLTTLPGAGSFAFKLEHCEGFPAKPLPLSFFLLPRVQTCLKHRR